MTTDDHLNDLVEQLDRRTIDRRQFMQRAAGLGVSASAITAALAGAPVSAQDASDTGTDVAAEGVRMGMLGQLSNDLAAAVERAGASTVTVHGRRRQPASGIVWSADGLIVTANHVVERDEDLNVGLPDGRQVPVTVVGRDPGSDIALLKADITDLDPAPRSTQPAKIGHLVLAVARPGPSGPMASFGAVSVVGGAWRTHQGATVEGFVRADVAMLPGFSGGPLVDADGAVIGLNSSTLGRGGGLTVPVAAIDKIVGSLRTHGKVRRGFLGIGAQAARVPASLVSALELSQDRGLLLVGVEPDGPAERDGLYLGDVIVALNGETVTEVEELQEKLTGDWVGRPIPIKVIRGGQFMEVSVTVGERA